MTIVPPARPAVIICDDLPADYVRRMLGHRIDRDTAIFSRADALREAERGRNHDPNQHRPDGRPRRGRADR